MGALADLRGRKEKGPEPPGTWGPSGGSLPGALRGPRVLFLHAPASGPLGAPRAPGDQPPCGPEGLRGAHRDAGVWARGAGEPKERRGPCALGGTAAGPGAPGRVPRPGGSWGSAVLVINPPGASASMSPPCPRGPPEAAGAWGSSGPQGAPRGPRLATGRPPGGPRGASGAPQKPPAGPGGPPGGPQGPLGDPRAHARIPRAPGGPQGPRAPSPFRSPASSFLSVLSPFSPPAPGGLQD